MRQVSNVLIVQYPDEVPDEWPPNVDIVVEVRPDRTMRDGAEVVGVMVWHGVGREDCQLVRAESLSVEPLDTLADRVCDAVEGAVTTETNPTVRAIRDGVRRAKL